MHKGRQYPRHLSGFYLPGLPWTRWPPLELTLQTDGPWPGTVTNYSWSAIPVIFDSTSGTFTYTRDHADTGVSFGINIEVFPNGSEPGNALHCDANVFGNPYTMQNSIWPDGDSPFDYLEIDWAFTLINPFAGNIVHLGARCVRYH
jgi:hypothetical protein